MSVFSVKGDAVTIAGKRIPISVLALGVAGVGAFLLFRGHQTAAVSAGAVPASTSPYDALAGGVYDPNSGLGLGLGGSYIDPSTGLAGVAGGTSYSVPDPVAAFQAWFSPAVRTDLRPQPAESIGTYVSRVLTEFTSETSLVASQSSVYGIIITAFGSYPSSTTSTPPVPAPPPPPPPIQPNPGGGATPPPTGGAPPPTETGPAARHFVVTRWPAPGSSLSSIAQLMYGNASAWPKIYQANRALIGPNPNLIHVGWDLLIP